MATKSDAQRSDWATFETVAASGLLKWGVAALAISGIAFGLWMVLADPDPFGSLNSAQSGSKSSPDKVLDPDDPRSRKADRLPGASSF